MEQYPLGSLMQLREFRKEEAQRATTAQRHQVTAAQKAYQKGQEELEAFIIEVNQRIESIYDSVMNTAVSQKKLSSIFGKISSLYSEIDDRKLSVERLKQNVEKEKDRLAKLQDEQLKREQAVMKLQKHKEIWIEKQKQFEEYKADLELEEFKPRNTDFFDDNGA